MAIAYEKLKEIQIGSLKMRRIRNRIPVLFISANIWLDQVITKVLFMTQSSINRADAQITEIEQATHKTWFWDFKIGELVKETINTDAIQAQLANSVGMIDGLISILIYASLFFWFEIIVSLRFLYADYKCTYEEKGERQKFYKYAIVMNVLIFSGLKCFGL